MPLLTYIDIAWHSSAREHETKVEWGKGAIFEQNAPRTMTLNCYKFWFSDSFMEFGRFRRQQLLNVWR